MQFSHTKIKVIIVFATLILLMLAMGYELQPWRLTTYNPHTGQYKENEENFLTTTPLFLRLKNGLCLLVEVYVGDIQIHAPRWCNGFVLGRDIVCINKQHRLNQEATKSQHLNGQRATGLNSENSSIGDDLSFDNNE